MCELFFQLPFGVAVDGGANWLTKPGIFLSPEVRENLIKEDSRFYFLARQNFYATTHLYPRSIRALGLQPCTIHVPKPWCLVCSMSIVFMYNK